MIFSCFSCANKAVLFRNEVSAEYIANNVRLICLTRRRMHTVVKVQEETSVDAVEGVKRSSERRRVVKSPAKWGTKAASVT